MRKIGLWVLGCIVVVLALYGICRLVIDLRNAYSAGDVPTANAKDISVSAMFNMWVAYMQWTPKNPVPSDSVLEEFTILLTDEEGRAFAVLKLGDGKELCYCLQDAKGTVQGKMIVFKIIRDRPPPILAQ